MVSASESKHTRCTHMVRWFFKRSLRPTPSYPSDQSIWNLCYFTHVNKEEDQYEIGKRRKKWDNVDRNNFIKNEYTMLRFGRCMASKGSEVSNILTCLTESGDMFDSHRRRDSEFMNKLIDDDFLMQMMMFLRHFPFNEADRTLAHIHNGILKVLKDDKFWKIVDKRERKARRSELLLIGLSLFREDRSEERAEVWRTFLTAILRSYLMPPPEDELDQSVHHMEQNYAGGRPQMLKLEEKLINRDQWVESISSKDMKKYFRQQPFQLKLELFPNDDRFHLEDDNQNEQFLLDVVKDGEFSFIDDLLCVMDSYISCLVMTDFTDYPHQIDFCHQRIDTLLNAIAILTKRIDTQSQLYQRDFGTVFAGIIEAIVTQTRPAVHARSILFSLIDGIAKQYAANQGDWRWYTLYSRSDLMKLQEIVESSKADEPLFMNRTHYLQEISRALKVKRMRTDMSYLLLMHIPSEHNLISEFASNRIQPQDHCSFVISMIMLHQKCPFFWCAIAERVHEAASKQQPDRILLKQKGYLNMTFK